MRVRTLCLAAMLATVVSAQPNRHDRVMAVPAPGKVAVDGDLADWDLSGAIDSAFDESLRPKFAVKLAFMYDADALYISARFADDTPLRNRHDPKVEPNVGWNGDALQVRLCSDPKAPYPLAGSNSDRICHFTMWHFTGRKEPVLQIQYGMDYHGAKLLTGKDSGVAFRETKGGYVLEARIPWSRLNAASAPKAGDRLAMVVQPLWSDGSGWKQVNTFNDVIREVGFSFQGTRMWGQAILSPRGNLKREDRPASAQEALTPLTLLLPVDDKQATSVSAAVFDARDDLVRTLPVTRGRKQLQWDGLDDDGRPLAAGSYTVKTLSHRGIGQRYVTSLHSAGNPPWRTDDGKGAWGGDHGPPIAAAAHGERVFLGWTISEAGWAVVGLRQDFSADGKVQKLWGQHQVLDLGILVTAMDTDGERLFVAQDGQRWGQGSPEKFTAGVVLWNAKDGRPVNFPFGKRVLVVSEWPVSLKEKQGLLHEERDLVGPRTPGLNLMGLAIHGDRLYASLRLENKVVAFDWRTGKRVKEYPIPHPGGLAVGKDGRVLVVSDYSVMDVESGMTRVKWLKAPWDIAFDEAGRLYVTDCGRAMQVKVYEGSKQVAAIGRSGGRPWVGRYDPAGMLMPAGIVVDSKGKVWVTEHDSSPKRVSVWSRDGKLLADLLGPGAYAVEGDVDLARPAWVNTHDTLFDVDYKTGRARTVATLTRPNLTGLQFGHDGGQMGRALRFRHVKGKPYVVHTGRGAIVVYRLRDDLVCEPLAAMGDAGHMKFHLPEATRDALELRADQTIRWVDRNGNGLVELDEVDVEPVPTTFRNYWGPWIGDDLTVWNNRGSEVYRVPVQEWLPTGAPVYPKTSEQKPLFKVLGDQVTYLMPHDDAVYVLEMQGGSIQTGKGSRWSAISRYSLDGKRQWAYRRVWLGFGLEAPLAKPGDVVGAMKFIGTVELASGLTLVGVNGYFGQFNLLSETGLWVASLCKDNRYGPVADSTTVWPENFSGRLFRNRDDGKAYLIAGDTDTRIWEVTGLDGIHTRQASFTLSGTDHQKALAASLRKKGGEAKRAPIPLAKRKVTVDGKLDDWDMNVGVRIDAGGGRGATAALGYDGERLLAAFAVQDKSPMKNAGKDFALLFKSGDTCDVMLATDPKADPKRTKPAAGDLRLLFSVLDGKPVCVLYRPVVKEGAKAPRVLSSPVSAESFDQIAVLRDATVVIRRGENGYSLEAAVPLKTLRFAPAPGALVKGDVGVIFSDPGGSRNVLRAYHANRQTAIVNDIPSEARLTPQDWGWVRVE